MAHLLDRTSLTRFVEDQLSHDRVREDLQEEAAPISRAYRVIEIVHALHRIEGAATYEDIQDTLPYNLGIPAIREGCRTSNSYGLTERASKRPSKYAITNLGEELHKGLLIDYSKGSDAVKIKSAGRIRKVAREAIRNSAYARIALKAVNEKEGEISSEEIGELLNQLKGGDWVDDYKNKIGRSVYDMLSLAGHVSADTDLTSSQMARFQSEKQKKNRTEPREQNQTTHAPPYAVDFLEYLLEEGDIEKEIEGYINHINKNQKSNTAGLLGDLINELGEEGHEALRKLLREKIKEKIKEMS